MAQVAKVEVKRSARLVSPRGRVSYPHVFKPAAFADGEPKYSVTLMLDKKQSDTKPFIEKLKAAQEDALKDLYGKKLPTNTERWGITDGDDSEDDATKGFWLIKATSRNKPAVIDAQTNPILDPVEVYGGCYGRLNLNAKAYGTPAKGGVTNEFSVFQKIADGEAFGGAEKAKQAALSEMDAVEEEF